MQMKLKKKTSVFGEAPDAGSGGVQVTVSAMTIIKIIGVLVCAYFVWMIRDVLGILFVALVLASALDPWVDTLERYRVPRGVSIGLMYLTFLAALGVTVYLVIPPLITQVSDITQSLRTYAPEIDNMYRLFTNSADTSLSAELQSIMSNLNTTLANFSSSLFNTVATVFGQLATVIFILVITFYMTIEEDGLKKFVRSLAPVHFQPYLVQKTNRIQAKMGAWFRGQLVLMLIIGVLSFIGLFILQVPYALVLACIAGIGEFIPFLGPVISAVPAIFFAYTDSPWKAVAVLIMYVVLQQVENHIVAPQVMKKAVGLNPIVVITVMLIGAKVAGIAGILLAVPATTIIWIFVEDIFQQKKQEDNTLIEPAGADDTQTGVHNNSEHDV